MKGIEQATKEHDHEWLQQVSKPQPSAQVTYGSVGPTPRSYRDRNFLCLYTIIHTL